MKTTPFYWPEGKRAAISLTFDDGRMSQVDAGIPLLNRYGICASFYIVPSWAKPRLLKWKEAVMAGHEVGNHTFLHPGTGNSSWAKYKAIEEYSIVMLTADLDLADAELERLFGVRPLTFAYPCGQTFLGRGSDARSYVPLIAERFLVGRGWRNECSNDPRCCDLAYVMCMELDGMSVSDVKDLISRTREEGAWLVLCGHEIGNDGAQTTSLKTLSALCEYITEQTDDLWVAPVAEIGAYIARQRSVELESRMKRLPPDLLQMFRVDARLAVGMIRKWTSAIWRTMLPPKK